MSDNVAKVGEALRQQILARPKVVSNLQVETTVVVLVELIEYGRLSTHNNVDTIRVLWQGIPFILVTRNLLIDLIKSLDLVLADALVNFSPPGVGLLGGHHLFLLFGLLDLFIGEWTFWSDHHRPFRATHRIVVGVAVLAYCVLCRHHLGGQCRSV